MKHFHDAVLELKLFMYILSFHTIVYRIFSSLSIISYGCEMQTGNHIWLQLIVESLVLLPRALLML